MAVLASCFFVMVAKVAASLMGCISIQKHQGVCCTRTWETSCDKFMKPLACVDRDVCLGHKHLRTVSHNNKRTMLVPKKVVAGWLKASVEI